MNLTPRRSESGFNLIELVVTIAIIGVLASIAIPSYQAQVRKSRRTDARTALLDMAGREEKYNSVQNNYTNDLSQLGYGVAAGVSTVTTNAGYYSVTAAFVSAAPNVQPQYTLTATPVAGSGQDNDTICTSFTVNYLGVQTATGSGGTAVCWK